MTFESAIASDGDEAIPFEQAVEEVDVLYIQFLETKVTTEHLKEIAMSERPLDQLEEKFPEILDAMPAEFDSHEFILRLAHEYQGLYVAALAEYADTDRPFQIIHGQIALRLHNFPSLITKVGKYESEDIFHQMNSAAMWQKAE